jgi:hypothetical protein
LGLAVGELGRVKFEVADALLGRDFSRSEIQTRFSSVHETSKLVAGAHDGPQRLPMRAFAPADPDPGFQANR